MHIRDGRESINMESVAAILGESAAKLIASISRKAQENELPLFLAGGVVRDLLLGQRNLDLDFVVEGDATELADSLAGEFGGVVHRHPPFGTAKWILDATTDDKIQPGHESAKAQIDFAIAREETYESPAALPKVVPSSLNRDLARRDFTINAMGLQLSPDASKGRIVDPHLGLRDLDQGLIRVLHERSFVDDPTRIFRALRFAHRYGFEIEPQTERQMRAAVPIIARLSGERIRNEIHLILDEAEPERIILDLQTVGAFAAIDSAWRVSEKLPVYFARCRESLPPWPTEDYDMTALNWHLLLAEMSEDAVQAVCDRLTLTRELSDSITTFTRLVRKSEALLDPSMRPSQVTRSLEETPSVALHALWICLLAYPIAQHRIESFISNWKYVTPDIDGNELIRLGLQPGPSFRSILEALRDAWIDGEIRTEQDERKLLLDLLSDRADKGTS